jgi:hypothetical protein
MEPLHIPAPMRSRGMNQQKATVGHRGQITTGIRDEIISFFEVIAQNDLRWDGHSYRVSLGKDFLIEPRIDMNENNPNA